MLRIAATVGHLTVTAALIAGVAVLGSPASAEASAQAAPVAAAPIMLATGNLTGSGGSADTAAFPVSDLTGRGGNA